MRKLSRTEYNTIHQYHLRHWTKNGKCEHCNVIKKTQWANKSGRYIKGYKSDWMELCAKCHHLYDYERHIKTGYGRAQMMKELKGTNIKWGSITDVGERIKTYAWYKP